MRWEMPSIERFERLQEDNSRYVALPMKMAVTCLLFCVALLRAHNVYSLSYKLNITAGNFRALEMCEAGSEPRVKGTSAIGSRYQATAVKTLLWTLVKLKSVVMRCIEELSKADHQSKPRL
jgi:hypothetical protein